MKTWAVAANTFREAIRDKVLYNLVFFALLVMGASVVIGNMTLGEGIKIIMDLSLAAMSVFGLLIAIFVGIGLVHKEIQRRTVYMLLAKPISRRSFVIGKYLGLMLVIALNVAVMTAALLALMALYSDGRHELGRARRGAADPRRADGRDGGGGALLDVLHADALGDAHARRLGHRALLLRPRRVRAQDGGPRDAGARHRRPLRCCRTSRSSTSSTWWSTAWRSSRPTSAARWLYGLLYIVFLIGLATVIFERRDFK